MQQLTFRVRQRLARFVRRQTTKSGLGISGACQQLLEQTINNGIARMHSQHLLENEPQLRVAEDNLRQLISQLAERALKQGTFPVADHDALDQALKQLCPLWPYC